MRLFERLREKLGYEAAVGDPTPEASSKKAAAAPAPLVLKPTEGMCCGHCSGEAEGHSAEKSAA